MNRRRFLGRLGAAFAAALAAPTLLELLPAPAAPPLAFRSDAFGISMRFIRQFDVMAAGHMTRYDVLYGMALTPEWVCRVLDRPMPEPGGFQRYLDADRAIQNDVRCAELYERYVVPACDSLIQRRDRLLIDCWSTETLKVGDIITFASRPA